MGLLSVFFATSIFKEFEDKLERFLLLDKELSSLVEEIEQKSLITSSTFLFRKRVIDMSKIDKNKIETLLNLFESLGRLEQSTLYGFQKNKAAFSAKNEQVTTSIEQELGIIFQHVRNVKTMLVEIQEYIAEFKPEDLKNDFDKLNIELHEIRRFCEIIKEAVKQLESEKTEKPFLDVKDQRETSLFQSKLRKYMSDLDAIQETQKAILKLPKYNKKHHEEIKNGVYRKHLHARIKDNLRIIYVCKGETLIWEDILTKNDFDKIA